MNAGLLESFRYSAWATKRLVAVCVDLSDAQVRRPAKGFGSVLATLDHIVRCDAGYVSSLTGTSPSWVSDEVEADDLASLPARVDETTRRWEDFLAEPLDAERVLSLDGGTYEVSAGVVVAQALHHADAHREQVRAALRELGVEPPDVQPWQYALDTGRAHWTRRNP